ncbi:hypothetical protein OC835_004309 [Tilletia horrida]|nr:hypothetical protein OC835_004309 [Tilletia horrida]
MTGASMSHSLFSNLKSPGPEQHPDDHHLRAQQRHLLAYALSREPEGDLLKANPRNVKKDRLADCKLLLHAYVFVGLPLTLCCYSMAFWSMQKRGVPFSNMWLRTTETHDQQTTFFSRNEPSTPGPLSSSSPTAAPPWRPLHPHPASSGLVPSSLNGQQTAAFAATPLSQSDDGEAAGHVTDSAPSSAAEPAPLDSAQERHQNVASTAAGAPSSSTSETPSAEATTAASEQGPDAGSTASSTASDSTLGFSTDADPPSSPSPNEVSPFELNAAGNGSDATPRAAQKAEESAKLFYPHLILTTSRPRTRSTRAMTLRMDTSVALPLPSASAKAPRAEREEQAEALISQRCHSLHTAAAADNEAAAAAATKAKEEAVAELAATTAQAAEQAQTVNQLQSQLSRRM